MMRRLKHSFSGRVASTIALIAAALLSMVVPIPSTSMAQAQSPGAASGDVSCDGERTVLDALMVAGLVAGDLVNVSVCPIADGQIDARGADITGDGAVDAFDVQLILGCLVDVASAQCPTVSPPVPAGISPLWGQAGELWEADSRVPDYSFAGYASGASAIPNTSVVATVQRRDDGDDSLAISEAVAAAVAVGGGAVEIPAGEWTLTNPIRLSESGVVLRGAGQGATVLSVPLSAAERAGLTAETIRNLDGSPSAAYSALLAEPGGGAIIDVRPVEVPQPQATLITGDPDGGGTVERGDRTFVVNDPSLFTSGQPITVLMRENAADGSWFGSLFAHLHDEALPPGGWPTGIGGANASCGLRSPRWYFTVESIDAAARTITLVEPLPFEIRQEWNPLAFAPASVSTVGIEDLTIAFPETEQAEHLFELGYNGISFTNATDSWVRNVTIDNPDKGVELLASIRSTIGDVEIAGRGGHYGISMLYGSAFNLVEDVTIAADPGASWFHTFSLSFFAHSNVLSRPSGNIELFLDNHRASPFNNLITDVRSPASFRSSGDPCRGPHAGARLTVWNTVAPITGINTWLRSGNVLGANLLDPQITLVGEFDQPATGGIAGESGMWIEAGAAPQNLYEAQRALRLGG